MATKKVTVKDLVEALKENGYEQHFGGYFQYAGTEITAACALGQAAINLGVYASSLDRMYGYLVSLHDMPSIVDLNDAQGVAVKKIGEIVEEAAKKRDLLKLTLGELPIVKYKAHRL